MCIGHYVGIRTNLRTHEKKKSKVKFVGQELQHIFFMVAAGKYKDVKVMGQHMAKQISCDRSHQRYDVCTVNATTVLEPTTSTFFLVEPTQALVEKVRPYPRKWETSVMGRIKEVSLTSGPPSPSCQVHHSAPALVFSAGGYTGNVFHDFNDGFIPLFITVNSIFPDGNYVLVIHNCRRWWESKYADLLHSLSKHPIVNLEKANATHCFPYAHVGLISHGFMTIDPTLMPSSINLTHFRGFLDAAYAQNHPFPSPNISKQKARPRLVLVTRSGGAGRHILNQGDLNNAAEEVGFHVILFHPTPTTSLREAYALINSSHAMMGVHGAALTHSLFLRPGSVLMQVVPLGLAWAAETCFGNSSRELGLEYMEYKIGEKESSLADKYGNDDIMVKDPVRAQGKGWSTKIMDVYLKEQNITLDLVRFRRHLEEAYNKASKFMQNKG